MSLKNRKFQIKRLKKRKNPKIPKVPKMPPVSRREWTSQIEKNPKIPKIPEILLIIKTKTKYSINVQETEKFPKILKFRK